jgi:hypothetical protein
VQQSPNARSFPLFSQATGSSLQAPSIRVIKTVQSAALFMSVGPLTTRADVEAGAAAIRALAAEIRGLGFEARHALVRGAPRIRAWRADFDAGYVIFAFRCERNAGLGENAGSVEC